MSTMNKIEIPVQCKLCGNNFQFILEGAAYERWMVAGDKSLAADQIRLLVDHICDGCWKGIPTIGNTRTLVTKRGRSIETPYTDEQMIAKLEHFPAKTDFQKDIVAKRKKLKGDQLIWGHILVVEHEQPKTPQPKHNLGDMTKIVDMFAKAKQHLKSPKIRLSINNVEIRLSIAGKMSKHPGTIQVITLESRTWLGRIDLSGNFTEGRDAKTVPGLTELLASFAKDPLGYARQYGLLTGNCCFCNRTLTDERSTGVGYGPICAEHFGLAWGTGIGQNILDPTANELWTKTETGWSIEDSDLTGNGISECPCGLPLGSRQPHFDNSIDMELTHWTVGCTCGATLTIFND